MKQRFALTFASIMAGVFLSAVLFAGYKLVCTIRDYREGEEEYAQINEDYTGSEKKQESKKEDTGEEETVEDTVEEEVFTVDFDALLSKNKDTVAWIRFYPEPATISYPVVQTNNNETYLNRTFSGSENTLGTIFVNCENAGDFSDDNTIIYGHRMKNKMMFYQLQSYKEKAFWEANPYFYIYTPDGMVHTYEIFSCCTLHWASDTYRTQFDEDKMDEYNNELARKNYYDTGIKISYGDKVITLSTCTAASDDNRLTVRGVLRGSVPAEEFEASAR